LLTEGLKEGETRLPVFQVNNVYGIFRAVQSGLGLASLPDYLVARDSNLVRVLPELEAPSLEAYFVYPEALRHSARVTVFRDFLIRKISETEF
jgi:DNA-binding transcriptional LysR family regulator